MLFNNPDVRDLAGELRRDLSRDGLRAIQIDLDYVYDPDPTQLARNLDILVQRVKDIGPSHVFLQAFADPDGDGAADALYFPNRHLPMRADLFGRVAWRLRTRAGVRVFAWLPVLGFHLPDAQQQAALQIRGKDARMCRAWIRAIRARSSWSPTSTKTWPPTPTSKACCSMTMPICATTKCLPTAMATRPGARSS